MSTKRIAIIGGGPIGLMNAYVLSASRGFLVTVFDEHHARATYPKSGAFWLPFSSGASATLEQTYARPTHAFYQDLLNRHSQTGLYERSLTSWRCRVGGEDVPGNRMQWLKEIIPDYRVNEELNWTRPASFHLDEDGVEVSDVAIAPSWSCTTIGISPEKFIGWLKHHLVSERNVAVLDRLLTFDDVDTADFRSRFDAVVLCGGIRAFDPENRFQLNDQELRPSKGILARVKARHDLTSIHEISGPPFSEYPVYFVPLVDEVVLGGTVVATDLLNKDNLVVSAKEKSQLRSRFTKLMPAEFSDFLDAPKIEWTAGIRPRLTHGPIIRLDASLSNQLKLPVVVNVGHGGSGFTFGIGCGGMVREILVEI